jgi:acetate kinase
VAEIRRHLGGMLIELAGVDAIVFTGGIGENGVGIRSGVCAGLEELGISLNPALNAKAKGESRISGENSRVQVWTIPTNEELIVARQTKHVLET